MEKSKTNNNGILICLLSLICGALIMFLLCYFNVIKINVQMEQCNEQKASNEEKDSSNSEKTPATAKCYGTYYGEYTSTENGLTLDLKYTYILNEDGTFTADFSNINKTSGTFTINDNTISLTGKKEITGPIDSDPTYQTQDYVIADDCSYFIVNTGNSTFKVNKK
mgnify:CR=1 FL=1